MRLGEIIGHRAPIELLQRARQAGRLPHALLFHGPQGVGKGTVARAFATALLCARGEQDACGACVSCSKVAHRNHPDLLVVRRLPRQVREPGPMTDAPGDQSAKERAELSAQIRIFQIRQLIQHAGFAPREADYRIFLIDPAERMNLESQNALLKTLEEPPGRSILILISSNPHLLLPTVRSRCLAVGFAPLPAVELAGHLQRCGLAPEEALARAALSAGRPGRALELDLDEMRSRREELLSSLEQLADSPTSLGEFGSRVQTLAGTTPDELLAGLELIEGLLRDAARAATRLPSDSLLHADLGERLQRLGHRLSAERAGRLVQATERLRADLRFNLNRTLVAESLLAAVAGGPVP